MSAASKNHHENTSERQQSSHHSEELETQNTQTDLFITMTLRLQDSEKLGMIRSLWWCLCTEGPTWKELETSWMEVCWPAMGMSSSSLWTTVWAYWVSWQLDSVLARASVSIFFNNCRKDTFSMWKAFPPCEISTSRNHKAINFQGTPAFK